MLPFSLNLLFCSLQKRLLAIFYVFIRLLPLLFKRRIPGLHFYYIHLFGVCVCLCALAHVCMCTCVYVTHIGQKTTCKSVSFLLLPSGPRIALRLSDLAASAVCPPPPPRRLTSLVSLFLIAPGAQWSLCPVTRQVHRREFTGALVQKQDRALLFSK